MKGVLAAVGLPAAILLHSITAWIFGLQIARGFWYSAIMAPLFIASALVSGTGLMIVLALIVRRTGRISFKDDLVSYLGGMLAVFVAVEGFLVFSEMLTAAYPGAGFEADPVRRLLTGPYAGLLLVRGDRRAGHPLRAARRAGACGPTCAGWRRRRR